MLIKKYEENKEALMSIGREAIAETILNGLPLSAGNLANLFATLSPEEQKKFLETVSKPAPPAKSDEQLKAEHDAEILRQQILVSYRRCAEIVYDFNKALVTARIEGRWDDVVEHHYHRHYTEAFLRHTGALNHYLGKDIHQDDQQLFS